ncbi:type II secretion system protein F [Thermosipho sp. 1063]|uniref:type II secretion system F family protein n=1 Tax=unclassified Thermosipho (in: thermotogales) TaxID=2676525 RepID=UPI0009494C96|nr:MULTISPECIES: type II secretion system F family protein [unclassified Thermosipho (in: thermotogales)]ANQ52969.1 type II secretion system protein F [Thermosipho sp. 1070]APT71416.1 type II secretion system protein F [Thermosipho sp. 1063]
MKFVYLAYNKDMKKIKGEIEASSLQEALGRLKSNGLMIVDIKESKKRKVLKNIFGIPLKDIVFFTRQLETMIKAGLRLREAIYILSNQEIFSKRFRNVLVNVVNELDVGTSLTEAFKKQGVFDEVFINMLKAGEEGGVLEETLEKLSNYYENLNRTQQQVKTAMVYPIFILSFAIVVVLVISLFILPKLFSVFGNIPTSGLISTLVKLNKLLTENGFLVGFFSVLIFIGIYVFFKTEYGKIFKEFLGNLFPPIRKLREKITYERFSRTFGVLVGSGVSIIDSLEMAAKASNNRKFISKIKSVEEKVKSGSSLKQALKSEKVFPQIIYEMIGTGEETGKLEIVMEKVADFFDDQIQQDTKKLLSMLEPLMIAFVGLFIAFLAYTMYSTIFQMQSTFGG